MTTNKCNFPSTVRSSAMSIGPEELIFIDETAASTKMAGLRKAAARTIDELWDTIADCLVAFTPDECRNYFRAARYELEQIESALDEDFERRFLD